MAKEQKKSKRAEFKQLKKSIKEQRYDRPTLRRKKKLGLIGIIIYSIFIFPFLAGMIGTLWFQFNFPESYNAFSMLIILARLFLLVPIVFIGTALTSCSVKFHKSRKALKQHLFVNSKLDNSILQFLIDNQGNSFTIEVLKSQLYPEGIVAEMETSLKRLVRQKKVETEQKEGNTLYFINLKKFGLIPNPQDSRVCRYCGAKIDGKFCNNCGKENSSA